MMSSVWLPTNPNNDGGEGATQDAWHGTHVVSCRAFWPLPTSSLSTTAERDRRASSCLMGLEKMFLTSNGSP